MAGNRVVELRASTFAFVSKQILEDDEPVRFMCREVPGHATDSGWQIMSGLETEEYTSDPDNVALVLLADIAARNRRVSALLDEPPGSAFERTGADEEFERIADWAPPAD